MASIFRNVGIALCLGIFGSAAPLQAQGAFGVFQGDTTGSTFYDGSVAVGMGLPTTGFVSDFWNYDTATITAKQVTKIATEIANPSNSSASQKVVLAVLTNPTKESTNIFIQKLTKSGVSGYWAQQISDRLENLFKPNPNRIRKWDVKSELDLDPKQLVDAVDTYNKLIQSLDSPALASPASELIAIREILSQLVASSTPSSKND